MKDTFDPRELPVRCERDVPWLAVPYEAVLMYPYYEFVEGTHAHLTASSISASDPPKRAPASCIVVGGQDVQPKFYASNVAWRPGQTAQIR